MDAFTLQLTNLIENQFDFNEKYVETRDTNIQDWYIKNATNDEYNEAFVTELFNKLKKTFQTKKSPCSTKSSYSYKMKDTKITLKILYNNIRFWFCSIDNIKLRYNTATIESLEHELLLNQNISINNIEQSSSNKMIYLDNNNKYYTNYYVVSYNLVYPVSYEELGKPIYRPVFRNNCLSSFIDSCKSDIHIITHIKVKNNLVDLDELFYINDNYPQEIKDKIINFKNLYKIKKDNIDQLEETLKERLKDNQLKYNERFTLEESLSKAKTDMYNYFKSFFEIKNNWKIFIYAFIKDCPISF